MTAMQNHATALPGRAGRLRAILADAFTPAGLEIVDDSARHAGHAGATEAGETHYNVMIVSEKFRGLSRLARHRTVHAAVAPEFGSGLHALALVLKTPEEAAPPSPP